MLLFFPQKLMLVSILECKAIRANFCPFNRGKQEANLINGVQASVCWIDGTHLTFDLGTGTDEVFDRRRATAVDPPLLNHTLGESAQVSDASTRTSRRLMLAFPVASAFILSASQTHSLPSAHACASVLLYIHFTASLNHTNANIK